MKQKRTLILKVLALLALLGILPLLIFGSQTVQTLLIRATGTNAVITVDAGLAFETIVPTWKSFAQGGEESTDMIAPVTTLMSALTPKFIRIDHIFDHFNVVGRDTDGGLTFNFSELDKILASIKKTGATPFISLSYMPTVLAETGNVTDKPKDWNEWATIVERTVAHISGKNGLNLTGVYYEVWNEPDLFGGWKYFGDKNYLTMYTYSVVGATRAQNTNDFKIGGPATTQLYKNWVTALAKYVTSGNLRFDFFSWHRYSTNPAQYAKDAADITKWLLDYPELLATPRMITEWGFDSEMNAGYDGSLAAAHTVATVRQTLAGFTQLFAFEPVDGLDPAGKTYWGRWGLITHPSVGAAPKLRYHTFAILNKVGGKRLLLRGEGTWVTGFATTNADTIQILLVNYDISNSHVESTPITLTNMPNGVYQLAKTTLRRQLTTPPPQTITVTDNTFQTQEIMTTNSVVLLEFNLVSATPSATTLPSG